MGDIAAAVIGVVAPDITVARVAVTVEAVGCIVLHLHHARAQRAGGDVVERVIGVGARAPGAGRGGEAADIEPATATSWRTAIGDGRLGGRRNSARCAVD